MPLTWADLEQAGIRIPRRVETYSLDLAEELLAETAPGAVCVKAITAEHKARLGLVHLGIYDRAQLLAAWTAVQAGAGAAGLPADRILVQEQVAAGPELILGGLRDPAFGPAVVLGIGGRFAEAIARTEARLCPVDADAAQGMARALLGEVPGGLPEMVAAFSRLLVAHPEIAAVDLNPVILTAAGPVAVDLRVIEGSTAPAEPERPDSLEAIARLMSPESVAIIGASSNAAKPGARALRALVRQAPRVRVHPVNPRGGLIDGVPAVTSIAGLPDGVDAAIVATDAGSVPEALTQLAARGVRAAVVFAGGYREAGNAGGEASLGALARDLGIRFCGVNTIGLIGDAPLTFSLSGEVDPVPGSVSFLTQSGAIGGSMQMRSWAQGLGTARYICAGNQTDLDLADYLHFMARDESTRTIGMFIEGVEGGARFRRALREVADAGKGVVVLRSGTSEVGTLSALTHTGALAGGGRIYSEVFREGGVAVAGDLPELVAMCTALDWQPRAAGRRVAVLATSGGACSLIADMCAARGLEVPELEPEIQDRLRAVLPGFAPTRNPVETTGQVVGDPSLFGRMIDVVLDSARVDQAVLSISTLYGPVAERVAADIAAVARTRRMPVTVGWSLPEATAGPAIAALRAERIPVFDSWSLAVAGASALAGPAPARPADGR